MAKVKKKEEEKYVWNFVFKDDRSLIFEVDEQENDIIEEEVSNNYDNFIPFTANNRHYRINHLELKAIVHGLASDMKNPEPKESVQS